MRSCVYYGSIYHARLGKQGAAFSHPLGLFCLALDELSVEPLDRLVKGYLGLRFCEGDYLPGEGGLAERARLALARLTGVRSEGPVLLLAGIRSFGLCFNPLSLYYCYHLDRSLAGVVAEVTNTPWGERCVYALPGRASEGWAKKQMFVSPFLELAETYRWSATEPGAEVAVQVENVRHGRASFRAYFHGRRAALSARLLRSARLRLMASPHRTLALIYCHAIGLRLAGVRWHSHRAAGNVG